MINVEIILPVLMRNYEFSLAEDELISVLCGEIVELIGQNEQIEIRNNSADYALLDLKREEFLPKQSTLRKCGVKNGARLMLI